jgi:hypothetical protein
VAVLLLSLAVFALFFLLMSVRLFFVRNGEFRGTCASQSPWLAKEGVACGYCGRILGEGESCDGPPEQKIQPLPAVGPGRSKS